MALPSQAQPVQPVQQAPIQPEQAPISQAPLAEEQLAPTVEDIEEGISQISEEGKELLATFSIAPEFGTLMGEMFGPEMGEFFTQFSDPSLTIVVLPKEELDAVLAQTSDEPSIEDSDTPIDEPSIDDSISESSIE